MNRKAFSLPGKNPRLHRLFHAQLNRELLLGPRFVCLHAHEFNLRSEIASGKRQPELARPSTGQAGTLPRRPWIKAIRMAVDWPQWKSPVSMMSWLLRRLTRSSEH
jgi:hypothetical protein